MKKNAMFIKLQFIIKEKQEFVVFDRYGAIIISRLAFDNNQVFFFFSQSILKIMFIIFSRFKFKEITRYLFYNKTYVYLI